MPTVIVVSLMHDLLEAHCLACGFSLKGVPESLAHDVGRCRVCGARLAMRSNLSVSRRLPLGLGLLMGAFVASSDASPLLAQEPAAVPGFARRQR